MNGKRRLGLGPLFAGRLLSRLSCGIIKATEANVSNTKVGIFVTVQGLLLGPFEAELPSDEVKDIFTDNGLSISDLRVRSRRNGAYSEGAGFKVNEHQRDAAGQILTTLARIAHDERAAVLEVVQRIVLDDLCILDPLVERDATVRRDAHPVTDNEFEAIHAFREQALRGPGKGAR